MREYDNPILIVIFSILVIIFYVGAIFSCNPPEKPPPFAPESFIGQKLPDTLSKTLAFAYIWPPNDTNYCYYAHKYLFYVENGVVTIVLADTDLYDNMRDTIIVDPDSSLIGENTKILRISRGSRLEKLGIVRKGG